MNPTQTTWQYKTKDGTQTGHVVGVGNIVDGILEVPAGTVVENANLERITEAQPQAQPTAPAAPAASQPSQTQPINQAVASPPAQPQNNQQQPQGSN